MRGHAAVVHIGETGVRIAEDNVVEDVECLGAELEESLLAKSDMELPEQGQVEIAAPVGEQDVRLLVAQGIRGGIGKGRGVEPSLWRAASGSQTLARNEISALLVISAVVQDGGAGGNRVGVARVELQDEQDGVVWRSTTNACASSSSTTALPRTMKNLKFYHRLSLERT